MIWLALILGAGLLAAIGIAFVQMARAGALPSWSPRDLRAFIALAFSIIGAAALTALTAWIVWILWRGGWALTTENSRIDALAKLALCALLIVGIVLISLGLAINRRSVKASALGASFEAEGGDAEPTPAPLPVDKIAAAAAGAAAGAVSAAAAEERAAEEPKT